MRKSVEAAEKAGLYAQGHAWDRADFLKKMGKLLKDLQAAPGATPRQRIGLENGKDGPVVTIWHYLTDEKGTLLRDANGNECAFNISFPCPPWYPPSGICP
jgi:hypothetical protein